MKVKDKDRNHGIKIGLIERSHVLRYKFFCKYIKDGDKVLNAACGNGYGSPIIRKAGGIVTSVDIHAPAIGIGISHYSSDEWICGDLKDCPLGVYDAIVAFEILEHLPDPEFVTARFREHLKPGGVLVASVPNEDVVPFASFIKKNFEGHDYPHLRHYKEADLRALLEGAGFKYVEILGQHKNQVPSKKLNGYTLLAVCR